MSALRQRKGSRGKEAAVSPEPHSQHPNCCSEHSDRIWHGDWSWGSIIWTSVGWSVSVGLGLLCCIYVATLHENDLWFSNIKEVEREISFRTECGLYYSYYKQMLQAPTISEGRCYRFGWNVPPYAIKQHRIRPSYWSHLWRDEHVHNKNAFLLVFFQH